METDITIIRAPFAYIHAVYDGATGDYRTVEDWHTREQNGLPPKVILASKRGNSYYTTSGVKNGPVYPDSNFITCPDPEKGWDTLEAFVGRIGWAGGIDRRKLIYNGGKYPWQKALCPIHKGHDLWRGPTSTDHVLATLERAGVEVNYVNEHREIFCCFQEETE